MQRAAESGRLGLWDLRIELETVQYSPAWKRQLGFPAPERTDSTHFWRCRVHPDDLAGMLAAVIAHTREGRPHYESTFRLRSNGSGYRTLHSRGRVIQRGEDGRALRMVGTMIDLTERPFTPREGLPEGPRSGMEGASLLRPFHRLFGVATDALPSQAEVEERERVWPLVQDLLLATLDELDRLPAP